MSDQDRAADDFIQRAFAVDRPTPAEAVTVLAAARARFADLVADRRQGRRDGRKRIPVSRGLVEDPARITTPYQQQLISEGQDQIAEEFRRFRRRAQGLQHQLSELHGVLATASQAVVRARDAVMTASAELTQNELLPRTPQEAALADTGALRLRREAMRDRRIAKAKEELEQRTREADGYQRHIVEVTGRIDHEFAASQARGRRIADYVTLRSAEYWEALLKTHPDGRSLALLMPVTKPSLPAWLDGTCHGGVITLPSDAAQADEIRD